MAEESSTRITLKELYVQVQKIQSMLERLSGQLPGIAEKLDELEKDVNVRFSDHEERLRRVEMNMWKMFGAIGLTAAIAGPLISLLK